jgi:casein kinase II subunit beta
VSVQGPSTLATGLQGLEISSDYSESLFYEQFTASSATITEMSQTSSQAPDSWIAQFCSLVGHEYFAEVSEDFIEDDFNLTGLQSQVPMYKEALEMILDVEPSETGSSAMSGDGLEEEEEEEEEEDDDGLLGEELDEPVAQNGARRASGGASASSRRHGRTSSDTSVIESSAELLYGLIHARYITSRPGIQQMMEKYELSHFGYCPRVYCGSARVLPVGLTDTPGQQTVKLFCPSCLDVYTPPNSRFQAVDGAFFGTTFGCLFFMTFPDLDVSPPKRKSAREGAAQGNEDNESVLGQDQAPGVTASRSSSLTLPNPPAVPGATMPKDDKTSSSTTTQPSLPAQPTVINGVATGNLAPGLGKSRIYEPKIYGFKVSERAKSGPRMKWLRSKPADVNELDEARIYHEGLGGDVEGDLEMTDEATTVMPSGGKDGDGDALMASQSQNAPSKSSKRKSGSQGQRKRDNGTDIAAG